MNTKQIKQLAYSFYKKAQVLEPGTSQTVPAQPAQVSGLWKTLEHWLRSIGRQGMSSGRNVLFEVIRAIMGNMLADPANKGRLPPITDLDIPQVSGNPIQHATNLLDFDSKETTAGFAMLDARDKYTIVPLEQLANILSSYGISRAYLRSYQK